MALKALVSGKITRAEDLSEDQFRALQSQKPQVAMLCCQTRGYMRIREEYQEFVHFRRIHDCLGRPDSPVHDFLKKTVRDAARTASWDADFEVPDPRPDRKWIADVLATKGNAQVAIEIQISPITREELTLRQHIYAECGIRSCWLLKHKAVWEFVGPPDKDVPVFDLTVDKSVAEFEASRYFVSISPRYKMPIVEATTALLNGEFRWCASRRTRTRDNLIILRVKVCPHCQQPFGMYKIETTRLRCGGTVEEQPQKNNPLERHITDAVESFVKTHPDLDFEISYPRRGACPRSGIVDTYFTCSHCQGLIGLERHEWHWDRYAEVVQTIPLGKARESHSRDAHWCFSPEKDFCLTGDN
jgi:hypothetical protein